MVDAVSLLQVSLNAVGRSMAVECSKPWVDRWPSHPPEASHIVALLVAQLNLTRSPGCTCARSVEKPTNTLSLTVEPFTAACDANAVLSSTKSQSL